MKLRYILLAIFSLRACDARASNVSSVSINVLAVFDTSVQQATVSVKSNVAGAKVFIDSLFFGTAPLDSVKIIKGNHILWVVHPDERSWYHTTIVDTLYVSNIEHIERLINFPSIYHITSEPYGATVYCNDSVIGITPFILSTISDQQSIKLSKDGFEDVSIPLNLTTGKIHAVLQPLHGRQTEPSTLYLSGEPLKSSLPLYITTTATVVTGISTAFFKIKADNLYAEYKRVGDHTTLDRVQTYDTISGITLAACELNILILTYLLLSR
jgi:hypothetical protein